MSEDIVVKGYKIGKKVSTIGMRSVYRAQRLSDGKDVRMTVVLAHPGRSLNLLLKRAEQSKILKFPGFISALDCGVTANNQFYYTTLDIYAVPLKSRLNDYKDKAEKLFAIIRYGIQTLEVLDYIHRANTTHRNITCDNILIDYKDRAVFDGFIHDRPKFETPNAINAINLPYISPEQLTGCAADKKTDLYSFGIVLYEFMVGHVPYMSNFTKIEDARKGELPSLPADKMAILPAFEKVMNKLLATRESRYPTARRLVMDMEKLHHSRSFVLKFKDLSRTVKNLFTI